MIPGLSTRPIATPRRRHRHGTAGALGALGLGALLAAALPACDNTTEGQPAPVTGPPVLLKIMIQDETASGGRHAASDLLDRAPPIACDWNNPCPTGDVYGHPLCDVDASVCPDPLNPVLRPPAVGTPVNQGGTQFRLVFNKPLAADLFMTTPDTVGGIGGSTIIDPSVVGVYDASGVEIPAEKYWDPTGVPAATSNLFSSPFGPALVVKPKKILVPLTSYSVRFKPELVRDADGQTLRTDVHGDAVKAEYPFFTEGFWAAGGATTDLVDGKINPFGAIDVRDAYVIRASAAFDPKSLVVSVKRDGQPVEIAVRPGNINSLPQCPVPDGPTAIMIFRSSGGYSTDWEVGTFTASIDAVAADNPQALFSADPFGKTRYRDVPFTTLEFVDPNKLFRWLDSGTPEQCEGRRPPDMNIGYVPDMAVPDGG